MNDACSTLRHEEEKRSPEALAMHYDTHAEPWTIGGAVLLMFTCRRCHSTVCVEVQS